MNFNEFDSNNMDDHIIKKIKKVIENANLKELRELKSYLQFQIEEIIDEINKRIEKLEESKKVCAVCGTPISEVDEPFELIFGKRGFRKKAYFCGIDCLNFFLHNYHNRRRKFQKMEQQIYF